MASIIKRKKNYSIVYTYVDENGETKQKWETRTSYQEALKRKAEIESQKSSNSFLPPTNQNIAEFLSDFVSLYGEKRWGVSMYDSQNSLIANYINPIIGDMKVQDIHAGGGQVHPDFAENPCGEYQDAPRQNGVCHQRHHREDHQTSPLCLQAGGSVGTGCQESL